MELGEWVVRMGGSEGIAKELERKRRERKLERKEGRVVVHGREEGEGGNGDEGSEGMKERRKRRKQLFRERNGNRRQFGLHRNKRRVEGMPEEIGIGVVMRKEREIGRLHAIRTLAKD